MRNANSCDGLSDNTKPYTLITWLRIDANQLVEEHSAESPYDIDYKDSNWVVATRKDARSPKEGGEVYRLGDGSKLTPFLSDYDRR